MRYSTSDVEDFGVSLQISYYFGMVNGVMAKLKREIERARARNEEISLLVRSGKL